MGRFPVREVLIGFLVLAPASRAETPPVSPNAVRMGAVAKAFEAVEASLAAASSVSDPGSDAGSDSTAVHAASLRHALERAKDVSPQRNDALAAGFERYRGEALLHAGDVGTLAEGGDVAGARESLRALRRTCVSCHVKFRSLESEAGLFPGKHNTVTGTVTVRTVDGEIKKDASGVVVFVDGVDVGAEPPRRPAIVSQRDRMFMPRILPVLKGTTVAFPNDDTIFHNAFSLSKTNPFDLGIYDRGESKTVVFDETGLVRVYCNIHPSMVLNVLVLDNPLFDVTDEAGLFVLPEVPNGEVVLRTWSERGGETNRTLSVSGGRLVTADVSVHETEHVAAHSHTNKFGKPYRGKYR